MLGADRDRFAPMGADTNFPPKFVFREVARRSKSEKVVVVITQESRYVAKSNAGGVRWTPIVRQPEPLVKV